MPRGFAALEWGFGGDSMGSSIISLANSSKVREGAAVECMGTEAKSQPLVGQCSGWEHS